jgi:hypothetical protein
MANTQKYTEIINKYLDINVTVLLVEFLNNVLPIISNKWWEKTVIDKLTDDQKKNVNRKKIKNLDGLDLAALLRIFDMNWNEISQRFNFLYEDRNILKEMQAVRNRWSHKPKTGYSLDDIYRDFDTIQRFLKLFNTNQEIIIELQRIKQDIMQEMNISGGKVPQRKGIKKPEKNKKEKSTSIKITGKDIINMEKGDTISTSDLSILIKNSKEPNSDNWTGEDYIINNTPQKGINWIGNDKRPLAVITKTNLGRYAEDNNGKTYAFEAEKGKVNKAIKTNQVLINQPKYNYPILYFIKKRRKIYINR